MPLATGLMGDKVAHLLATLVVIHTLKAVAGTPVSLSVDQPLSALQDVVIVDSAEYPLIAIVTCTGGQLQAQVNEDKSELYGDGSLEVQLEESGNKPNEYFLLPNNTGRPIPEGDYMIDVLCSNQSLSRTATLSVSVIPPSDAAATNHPYFIDSQRFVSISAATPPGTIVANFRAKFPSSRQPGTRQYVVHTAFSSTLFQLNGSSGDLVVKQSLQEEHTLSTYDIVIVADQGHSEAWTLTTIIIVRTYVSPSPTVEPQDCVGGTQKVASAGTQYAYTALIVVSVVLAVLFLLSLLIIIILVVWVARLNKQMKIIEEQSQKQVVLSPGVDASLDDQMKNPANAYQSTAFL